MNQASVGGFWFLDEGYGNSVQDRSGNDNDGEIRSKGNNPIIWVPCSDRTCLRFHISKNHGQTVEIRDDSTLRPENALTAEAWVDPDSGSDSLIVGKIQKNQKDGFGIGISSDRWYGQISMQDRTYHELTGDNIHLDQWSYLVITYDNSTFRIYLDGVQMNSMQLSGEILSEDVPVYIGSESDQDWYFEGYIANVGIWGHAFTPEEVAARYDSWQPAKCP